MTNKQVFDKVKAHLLQQNERCLESPGTYCLYLNENGLKCAIGALIPDGHEAQSFIGSVGQLLKKYPDLKEHTGEDLLFLKRLQGIHDTHPLCDWASELDKLSPPAE